MLLAILLFAVVGSCNGFWFWSTKRCYDRIGCFSNAAPFTNALYEVPQSPERLKPDFLLYTRDNPEKEQFLHALIKDSIHQSNFSPDRNTKVIIHGYIDNGRIPWIKDMTSAILSKDNVNVIAVNWVRGSQQINYAQSAANTRVIGALLAELIQTLSTTTEARLDSFHLIGHSLGAHIAGYAGERLDKVGRITGLDPAGPLFLNTDPLVRLDPSDAIFVDAIHTDGNRIGGFGLFPAVGTVDFYPNGGKHQPGCGPGAIGRVVDELAHLEIKEFSGEVACDHTRATDLFTASVHNPCLACACPDDHQYDFSPSCRERCTLMGYYADYSEPRGVYYLTTGPDAPYCPGTLDAGNSVVVFVLQNGRFIDT